MSDSENNDDWLDDLEAGRSNDDIAARRFLAIATEDAIAKMRARPKYEKSRELTMAFRRLTRIERLFVRAMEAAGYDVRDASMLMTAAGLPVTVHQLNRMNKRKTGADAIELSISANLKRRRITRDGVLTDVARLRDYGMEQAPEYVQGKPTGRFVMRNPELADRALDKLGKHTKAWDTDSNRVTVGIQVIDYTETRGESEAKEKDNGLNIKVIDVAPEPDKV